ncbi:glycosyl transferase family 1 [Cellvibrio sp. KY-GH-1]|uniref:glycoside hydrolase family 26 protein n=1 Tax=Cellvibrio sp. KY-GH-1 TaxID=2303332 RepID=UPI001247A688|nr:glycosyl hydrolase [Cellvibrio sp. KY-GH-1]QEY17200.1 glycosyl transferase family 1 [Cellvibrio sp. KY-GH-1]
MSRLTSLFNPLVALLLLAGLAGCDNQSAPSSSSLVLTEGALQEQDSTSANRPFKLIDKDAIPASVALYNNLAALRGKHFLFGHQDSLAYGVNWEGDLDRSDVRDVTGSNPAVYGWEIGGLELGHEKNLDGVNFKQMQEWIKAGFNRGGVITISWHMYSPVSGGNSWDKTPTVHELVPGGAKHEELKKYLDAFVEFNEALVVTNAQGKEQQIPIIFRPWHEHNGDWFWWGKGHASEQDYIALYQFTVKYLRDEKDQHNLIFAFSPDRSRIDMAKFESDYFYGYPGDEYVDVIGLDNYWDLGHEANTASADEQKANFTAALRGISKIAQLRRKIAALTETGNNGVKLPNLWTDRILGPVLADPDAQLITYVLVWRNANSAREKAEQFYAPYAGHASADNFKAFLDNPFVMFESELPNLYQ